MTRKWSVALAYASGVPLLALLLLMTEPYTVPWWGMLAVSVAMLCGAMVTAALPGNSRWTRHRWHGR